MRAFLLAGCPSVMASLWPLRDDVAAEFAHHFYQAWAGQGQTLVQAHRQAALAIRRDHSHVFAWAPFVLMGAWNTRTSSG